MQKNRYLFLDQVRGYAIFGMILVNFLGIFDVMPWMLKHHRAGFSYADHIAPLFIFVVGIGYRMSFLSAVSRQGLASARWRALRRYLIICGIGLLYGGFDLLVGVWDALLDIGTSGLLALPLMYRSSRVRAFAAVVFLGAYQTIYSLTGYGDWVLERSINGGPLGPLSWVFVLLMGTVAYDWVLDASKQRLIVRFFAAALLLSAAGWLLRAEWPGIKALWHFSQFGMSAPYPVYAAGLCFLTAGIFYLACEVIGVSVSPLTTLGKNPLVIYLVQAVLVVVAEFTLDHGMGIPGILFWFTIVLGICYGIAWYLERSGRIIKIG